MKRYGNIALVLLVAGLTAFLVFVKKRSADSTRLQTELQRIEADRARLGKAASDLVGMKKVFPRDADVAAFIEQLYLCAQEAAVRNHTVVTAQRSGAADGGGERANRTAAAGKDGIETHRLLVSLEGSYRDVAEYIRLVQNMERFKKITVFSLKPADGVLSAAVELELYTLKVPHGI